MSTKVDPGKVEELSVEYNRLSRLIEDIEMSTRKEISNLISETNAQYSESYVRSTTSEMDGLLREIRNLAASITDRLTDQAKVLHGAAGRYRSDEDAALGLLQKSRQRTGFTFTPNRSATSNASSPLDRYRNDKEAAKVELLRARDVFEREIKAGKDMSRLNEIIDWMSQVREAAGIGSEDEELGNMLTQSQMIDDPAYHWTVRLEVYKTDMDAAKLKINRAKQKYKEEAAKVDASPEELELISKWAKQVRLAAGISIYDPEYGNAEDPYQIALSDPTMKEKLKWWEARFALDIEGMNQAHTNADKIKIPAATAATQLIDEKNTEIFRAKIDYYQAIINMDEEGMRKAQERIREAQLTGGTIQGHDTALDRANRAIIQAKIDKWKSVENGDASGVQDAIARSIAARHGDADSPWLQGAFITDEETALDTFLKNQAELWKNLGNGDYSGAFESLKTMVKLNKEASIQELQRIGLKQEESDKLLLEATKMWWNGIADLSADEQQKAAEIGTLLRKEFGASGDTEEIRKVVEANELMLAAKRDYWVAALHVDKAYMDVAEQAMRNAQIDGASISADQTALDAENRRLLQNKINYYEQQISNVQASSTSNSSSSYANIVQSYLITNDDTVNDPYMLEGTPVYPNAPVSRYAIRSVYDTATGRYETDGAVPGSSNMLDQLLGDLYQIKKGKWADQVSLQNNSIPESVKSYIRSSLDSVIQKGIDLRKQLALILSKENIGINVPDDWVIDVKNQSVFDAMAKIQQYVKNGDTSAGQREFDNAKKLLNDGATVDIASLVTRPVIISKHVTETHGDSGEADKQREAVKVLTEKWIGKLYYEHATGDLNLSKDVKTDKNGGQPHGLDCSGFVRSVFNTLEEQGVIHVGYKMSDATDNSITIAKKYGTELTGFKDDLSKLKVGDLLFFEHNGNDGVIDHVAIYIGDGKIIHSNGGGRVNEDRSLDSNDPKNYVNIKSIVDDKGNLTAYNKIHLLKATRLIKDDTTQSSIQGTGNLDSGSNKGFDYQWTGKHVTDEFKAKVLEICDKLNIDPDDLMAVMAFESGGINPAAINPTSDATGLIQFMPSTARRLGTTTDALAKMSAVEQLDFVYKYYKPYAEKIHNIQDVYMVTFMPIAVGKPNDFKLGIKDSEDELAKNLTYSAVYRQNAGLDKNGNGIITKEEAAQKVVDKRNSYKKVN